MPRGDRTGPDGYGPMTGRGLGYCNGYDTPGFTKGTGMGRGCGYGYGRGASFGRGRFAPRGFGRYQVPVYNQDPAPAYSQKEALSNQAQYLEKELEQIRAELKKMEEE